MNILLTNVIILMFLKTKIHNSALNKKLKQKLSNKQCTVSCPVNLKDKDSFLIRTTKVSYLLLL